MKHTKLTAIILAAMMLLTLFAGCAKKGEDAPKNDNPEKEDTSITVTDMTGRTVTLEKPAERVVALTASDCEILYAIGAGDKLVGRGLYCDYPAEVLDITPVESGASTNIEEIVSLDPDVLLMSGMDQSPEQVSQLEEAGIKVVVSEAYDIEGVYTSIQLIGDLMGQSENAAA
ncbi:MAG: ABC transporter substrate-binding protein, partial [Oscillospiraceae bacterium]|nr:ABC transporter substrate-binding protein [Oscillospiraceae bacterium]